MCTLEPKPCAPCWPACNNCEAQLTSCCVRTSQTRNQESPERRSSSVGVRRADPKISDRTPLRLCPLVSNSPVPGWRLPAPGEVESAGGSPLPARLNRPWRTPCRLHGRRLKLISAPDSRPSAIPSVPVQIPNSSLVLLTSFS